jgi:hypothetical protein
MSGEGGVYMAHTMRGGNRFFPLFPAAMRGTLKGPAAD